MPIPAFARACRYYILGSSMIPRSSPKTANSVENCGPQLYNPQLPTTSPPNVSLEHLPPSAAVQNLRFERRYSGAPPPQTRSSPCSRPVRLQPLDQFGSPEIQLMTEKYLEILKLFTWIRHIFFEKPTTDGNLRGSSLQYQPSEIVIAFLNNGPPHQLEEFLLHQI